MLRRTKRTFHIPEWVSSLHAKETSLTLELWPWNCRFVMNMYLKHIWQCFPVPIKFTAMPSGTWPSWEKILIQNYTGTHHGPDQLVSNHCHLNRKWLYKHVISETKVVKGGQVMVEEKNLNGNNMSEKKVYDCLKKSSEWEKLTKEEAFQLNFTH